MKNKKVLSKFLIALVTIALIASSIVAIILNSNNNQSQDNVISANNDQVELNAALTINQEFGDGTVTGEFVIGGTRTGSKYYADGANTNGYCMEKGKTILGTAVNNQQLYSQGSAYGVNTTGSANVNQLRWLYDNIRRMNLTNNNANISHAENDYYKNLLITLSGYNGTAKEIFLAQQYAIWHFTNGTGCESSDANVIKLYNALVNDANSHASYVGDGNNVVSASKGTGFTMKQSGSNIVIGPITISNPKGKRWRLKTNTFTMNGASVTANSYISVDGTESKSIARNSFTTHNGSIYIVIKNYTMQYNVTYNFSGVIRPENYTTNAVYWKDNNNSSVQSVTTLTSRSPVGANLDVSASKTMPRKGSGSYNLSVKKVDATTSHNEIALGTEGQFSITQTTKGKGTMGNVSTNNGTMAATVAVPEIAQDYTDVYTIQETAAPTGYVKYDKNIQLSVKYGPTSSGGISSKISKVLIGGSDVTSILTQQATQGGSFNFDNGMVDIQIASNNIVVKIANQKQGLYSLQVNKFDNEENLIGGAEFSANKYLQNRNTGVFASSTPTAVTLTKDETNSIFRAPLTKIESTTNHDIIEIKEDSAPVIGSKKYTKLDKKIVLQVVKGATTGKCYVEHINIYAIDSSKSITNEILNDNNKIGVIGYNNGTVTTTKNTAYNGEATISTQNGSILYNDGACHKFSINVAWDTSSRNEYNAAINVNVYNYLQIDVALKKIITKVNGIDVTNSNGFSTDKISNYGYNTSTLATTTNATYNMNKTPVEVHRGDEIEYSIKVYNEGSADISYSVDDYIPVGLTINGVKTGNSEWDSSTLSRNYNSKIRTLFIPNDPNNPIPAYEGGTELHYDEIIVTCTVDDDAVGVLTNVAEIYAYYVDGELIYSDVDSIRANWEIDGKSGPSADKGNTNWRNYSNNQADLDWSTDHLAQDAGVNNNKGDDDDYDKLIVTNEYKFQLHKVSNEDNTQNLQGAKFYINNVPYKDATTEALRHTIFETDSNGYTFNKTKILTFNAGSDEQDVYYIKETSGPADSNYAIIDQEFELRIQKATESITTGDYTSTYSSISGYSFVKSGEKPVYHNLSESTQIVVQDVSGNNVTVVLSYNEETRQFTLTMPNNIVQASYGLKLIKIKEKANETDSDEYLEGVKFGINTIAEPKTTDRNGEIDFGTYKITAANYNQIDEYTITEIEDTNSVYYQLKNPISLKVKKDKTNDKTQYKVSGVSLNNSAYSMSPVSVEVELKNTTKTATVLVTPTTNLITIKVENSLIEGSYSLVAKKVDASGNAVQEPIGFSVNDEAEKFTNPADGTVTLVDAKKIDVEKMNAGQKDASYVIKELTASSKYVKIKNVLVVDVYAANNGQTHNVSKVVIKEAASANMNIAGEQELTVEAGKYGTLKYVELEDGTTVDVNVDLQNGNKIVLTVPNNNTKGSYSLQVYKYSTTSNNVITPLANVGFTFAKGGSTVATRYTTAEGIAEYTGIDIEETGTDTFTINELVSSNSQYVQLAEPITINVTKALNAAGNGYVISNAKFGNGSTTTTVNLANGKTATATISMVNNNTTVKVGVENPPLKGKYLVDILKVNSSGNPVGNVTFGIRKNNAATVNNYTTNATTGLSQIANVAVTAANAGNTDIYSIEEISFATDAETNKYIKLKSPLTLSVITGKNKLGEAGTESAPGTRYVASRIMLVGQGLSTPKSITLNEGSSTATLTGIALENNFATVNINVALTEETDSTTGEKVQRIALTIPNIEREGSYNIQIKKVNASKSNIALAGAMFKVEKIINGEHYAAENTARTGSNGTVGINSATVDIAAETLETDDVYTISEVKIFKSINGSEEETGLAKLAAPITLNVKKHISGGNLDVESLTLSQGANRSNVGESIALNNVLLDSGEVVAVKASIDENNLITITVPNKEFEGSYRLNLIKTRNNFETPMSDVAFTYTGNLTGAKTDTNGLIAITGNNGYTITKDNVDTTDIYEINEVEDKANEYLELANTIKVSVTKKKENNKFVVDNVTAVVGNKMAMVSSSGVTEAVINDVATVNGTTTTKVKITLDAATNLIKVYADNPSISGNYSLNIKKIDGTDENKTLGGAEFKAVKRELSIETGTYEETKTVNATTKSEGTYKGYAFIVGDDPTTVAVEASEEITTTRGNDKWRITELSSPTGYIELKNVAIDVDISKEIASNGKNYVVSNAKATALLNYSSDATEEEKQNARALRDELTKSLDVIVSADKTSVSVVISNTESEGKYNLQVYKYEKDGGPVGGVGFNIFKQNSQGNIDEANADYTGYTTSDGIISYTGIDITEAGTDTYVIKEIPNADSKYVQLKNPITIKVTKELSVDGTMYIASNATFEDGSKETTVELANGSNAVVTIDEPIAGANGVNTIKVNVENTLIEGSYKVDIMKTDRAGNRLKGVTFKVNNTSYTLERNSLYNAVEVANKAITAENVSTVDQYTINEVSFVDEADDNKYIKLNTPINLYVYKAKNTEQTATLDAAGTKYVVNKFVVTAGSKSASWAEGTANKTVILKDVVIDRAGDTIDITTKIDFAYENPIITITVPNIAKEGSYALKLNKVNASNSNANVEGAQFKVDKKVNGTSYDEQLTSKTNANGLVDIESRVTINYNKLDVDDTYTISEVKVYKSATSTEEETAYIKLKNPLTLTVQKGIIADAYGENTKLGVTGLKLSEQINETTTNATTNENATSITLPNVKLANDETVTIRASLDKNAEIPTINLVIPNKEDKSAYKIDLYKTTADFTKAVPSQSFEIASPSGVDNCLNAGRSDVQGKIPVIVNDASIVIDRNNVNNVDVYTFKEFEDKTNNYVELANTIKVSVTKEQTENGFAVKTITVEEMGVNGQTITVNRNDTTNSAEAVLNNVATLDGRNNAKVKVMLDSAETTNNILVYVDNPAVRGEYKLKLKKVDSNDATKTLGGAEFNAVKREFSMETMTYVVTKDVTATTKADGEYKGYAFIAGDDPTTANIESNEEILSTRGSDFWRIKEVASPDGYVKLNNIAIEVEATKSLSNDGKKYIITNAKATAIADFTATTTDEERTRAYALRDFLNQNIQVILNSNGTEINVVIPNVESRGQYNLEIFKCLENGESAGKNIGFNIYKADSEGTIDTTTPSYSAYTNESGIIKYQGIDIAEAGIDTFRIEEILDNSSKFVQLDGAVIVKVTKTLQTESGAYVASDANFENGTKETTVALKNGQTARITIDPVTVGENGTSTIKVNVENTEISGKYKLNLQKTNTYGTRLKGVTFKVNNENYTVSSDGSLNFVSVAEKEINSANVDTVDTYEITEVGFTDEANVNKYVKISKPITLTVYKGKNATGTMYVAKKIVLTADNKTTTWKYGSGSTSFSIANVAIDKAGDVVRLQGSVSTTTAGSDITLTIPNMEKKGEYSLKIKKVNASNSNAAVEGAQFTVAKTADTLVTAATETEKSDANGYVYIAGDNPNTSTTESNQRISYANLAQDDVYTISEVKVFKSATSTEEAEGIAKLKYPLELTVQKGIVADAYGEYNVLGITGLKLSEIISETSTNTVTSTGTSQLTLSGVKLENNETVQVVATIDTTSGTPSIILTIPNKSTIGEYKVNIYKTTNDFAQPLQGQSFRFMSPSGITNCRAGGSSDANGLVPIIMNNETVKITKDTVDTVDEFSIMEVSDSSNEYDELACQFNLRVSKELDTTTGKYKISSATLTEVNGTHTPITVTRNSSQSTVEATMDNITTTGLNTRAKIKLVLDTSTDVGEVKVYIDNPEGEKEYNFLNIVKKTAGGSTYDGAVFELYSVDTTTNEQTLIRNNIVDGTKQYNITYSGQQIQENRDYKFAIKEVSTEAPHINILENKQIIINARVNNNGTEKTLSYSYDVCNMSGTVLANDSAREFIKVEPVQDETTGNYTLNVTLENPMQFKMNFQKVDSRGTVLNGKTIITINNVENTGSASQTISNLKIGDVKSFVIGETSVDAPFVNILGNDKILINTRLMENGKMQVVGRSYIAESNNYHISSIPSRVSQYFSAEFEDEDGDGIETLQLKLENPISYKIRITKQDMAGLGLQGTDITARYNGTIYTNEGLDYIEIPVELQDVGKTATVVIKENSSAANYENVFDGKQIVVVFRLTESYEVNAVMSSMIDNGVMKSIPAEYFDVSIDDISQSNSVITANIVLKNPIKYKFEVVKTDLAHNELSGEDLRIKVTRNTDTPVNNEGASTISFDELDLAPNTVNKYVVEELSSIAPYVNVLKNKKLTVEVRVDERGNLVVQKFEVTDVDGNVVTNDYLEYDTSAITDDGTRIVRVYVRNPMQTDYTFTKANLSGAQIEAAAIQITNKVIDEQGNEILDKNGQSRTQVKNNIEEFSGSIRYKATISGTNEDVQVGQINQYIIAENDTKAPYVNILGNQKIYLKTKVYATDDVRIIEKGYMDQNNNIVSNAGFGPYESYFTASIDYNAYSKKPIVRMRLKNPIQYKIRLYKVDENGNKLPNASFEILNKDTNEYVVNEGSDYIEYAITSYQAGNDTLRIREISSAEGYNNDLENKEIVISVTKNFRDEISISRWTVTDVETNEVETANTPDQISSISDYISQTSVIENGITAIEIRMKNTTDLSLNIVKQTTDGNNYDGAEMALYQVNTTTSEQTLIANNIVAGAKQYSISQKGIQVLPDTQYVYAIKELSTQAPHVNILKDKQIILNVKLNKNATTGALTLDHSYNVCDEEGNVIANDPAREFITITPERDETTGKYTINVYIQNPIEFKMNFQKVDTNGNSIDGKARITINGVVNNGSASETYTNLKVGDVKSFTIGEASADAPFTNILGESKILINTRVMENGKVQIVGKGYLDANNNYQYTQTIPSSVSKYFSASMVENEGVQTLQIKLQNPVKYKVRINKQDMAGLGLRGTDIVVEYNNTVISNNGEDYIEIPMEDQNVGESTTFYIRENSSVANYENVFDGKKIAVVLGINQHHALQQYTAMLMEYVQGVGMQTTQIPDEYFNISISQANETTPVATANITLKNPIKYNFEVVKVDGSGNEISGEDLQMTVTRNSDAAISNNGESRIKVEERDLAPNTVNTYVVKELSSILPYSNVLADKQLTVQVRVDESGSLLVQKFEVTDRQGNVVANDYLRCDATATADDGTRVVRIYVENPANMIFNFTKTNMNRNAITAAAIGIEDRVIDEQGNNVLDANGRTQTKNLSNVSVTAGEIRYGSDITTVEQNIKVGQINQYIVSEADTKAPYVNILGEDKVYIKVQVIDASTVKIIEKGYMDKNGNVISNKGFGKYEGYVTAVAYTDANSKQPIVKMALRNPIQYKIRINKVDENGNKLPNADFEILNRITGEIVRNETADYIEYTVTSSSTENDRYRVKENSSAMGYKNDLENKEIELTVTKDNAGVASVSRWMLRNSVTMETKTTNTLEEIQALRNIISYQADTEEGLTVLQITLKNTTNYNLNIVKQTTSGIDYNGAGLEIYQVENDTRTLIQNNIVNNVKQSNITLNNMAVLPNKTYTYAIKETSTNAPHVNILENKEIILTTRLNKNETTGELTLDSNYNVCDLEGNVLANDPAREFITLEPVRNETTGIYTINVYIKNPVKFNMNFTKTDVKGNAISGKAHITINGLENTGRASEVYRNLSIGDTVDFVIGETMAEAPFENVLGNNKVKLTAKVSENEKMEIISATYLDMSSGSEVETDIPDSIAEYLSYEFTDSDGDGVETLEIKLKNPVNYKFKLTKQDMAGLGIEGADISVTYKGVTYSTNGRDSVEIPVTGLGAGDTASFSIRENSSAENYENVFEGKSIVVVFRLDNAYELSCVYKVLVGNYGIISEIPANYFSLDIKNIEGETQEISASVVLKNPIKYDFEVVKTDLSGNEISGSNLQMKVTRNGDEEVTNNGESTIKFEERDLAPNAVNTYVIEELSTIAPHVNELKDKKLTAQVRVDEDGKLVVQKFEVTDANGNVVANSYIAYDDNAVSADGTRLVRVYVRNPISYKFKLIKAKSVSAGSHGQATYSELQGTSIQVNDTANTNGASQINMTIDDVKVGDTKTFVIKENSTVTGYMNLLENKEILLTVGMGSNKKLYVESAKLKDTVTNQEITITESVKTQYRFDYSIVAGLDGYETVQVAIINPIIVKAKVVKKDATGVTELSGAELALYYNNEFVVDNSASGSATLSYTMENLVKGDTMKLSVRENSTVKPNENILSNKELILTMVVGNNQEVSVVGINAKDMVTGETSDVSSFVTANVTTIDGIKTVVIEITNPVGYELDLVKNAAGVGFLANTKFQVYREGVTDAVFDGYVTDRDVWKSSELTEHNMKAGRYTYYITETKTARPRYVNILEDKYVKVNVEVSGTGEVTVMNNNWQREDGYYEIYSGDVANRTAEDALVDRTDLIYSNVTLTKFIDNNSARNVIKLDITNPIKYNVEVMKVDSINQALSGVDFELESQVINDQNATKTDLENAVGVDSITEDGLVTGTTNANGIISYQESFVNVGTYEYVLKEINSAGRQYVNIFKDYNIHFKVAVDREGNITLQNYEGGRNCYIEKDGVEADAKLYKFISLDTDNGKVIAKLAIKVENPVRFNVALHKEIYGAENISLSGAKFRVESQILKEQNAVKEDIKHQSGIDTLENGVITGTTDENASIRFEENAVEAGIYEYWISEIETGNQDIINGLQDAVIKLYIKVDSDGTIHTLTEDYQIIDGKFYIYDSTRQNKIDFAETSIDELVSISIDDDEVNTLNINVENPQKYDIYLRKTDIDTKENMNNVTFKINSFAENDEGELEVVDLKKAYDNTKAFDSSKLVTSTYKDENGVIAVENVLFEKEGTYYLEFVETLPEGEPVYKNKAENVEIKYQVAREEVEGTTKYVIKNMQVVSGERYVIAENTNTEDNTINVNITNERIKGSYNIVITKLEELLERPLTGAKFVIDAYKTNSEGTEEPIRLYRATNDVTSMESLIPGKLTIKNEDGTFNIEDIRIERAETYILQIKEIEVPDTYTILQDPIRLQVTTKIEGENDDAKYVLDSVELLSGANGGLVKTSSDSEKIEIQVKNNQFDLALRKYISSINGEDITRWSEPQVDTTKLVTGEATTGEYYNAKNPLRIYAGNEIIYTLRVYNEGQIDGYVNKIVDHLPEQLEFLPDDEFNKQRGWKYVEGDESQRTIETDYLSKNRNEEANVIKAFNAETNTIDYKEVQVKCKVKDNVAAKTYITNIAEIAEYEGKNRNNVVDRDSDGSNAKIPEGKDLELYKQDELDKKYVEGQEDDDDFEKVIVEKFDLSLRKFITKVNEKDVKNRVPVFKVDENGNYVYEHDKTPIIVAHQSVVEYTIRVFNEGTVAGYANLVKDDIPAGLVFLPENELNKEYRWKMLDKNGNETDDASKAKYIITDYISMENGKEVATENDTQDGVVDGKVNSNLLAIFDANTMESPDYRDLKVAFKVNVPVRSDDIIVNEAQISDDRDEHNKEVQDDDSTTDKWIEGEDDQDREYIRVKYFDLALYKWVTEAIVTDNGKTKVYPSNHTQDDKSNMVNVSIPKNSLNSVTVKFKYKIKVENQGNLAGYAKEIKDHIPEGLVFNPEDNAKYGWVVEPDGSITNTCFENTLLKEGDTAEVEMILTWVNGANNLGQKINYAEISKDYNDYGAPDIDSTPNNFEKTPREDDEDGDVVMLQIRTGVPAHTTLIAVSFAVIFILGTGVLGIKRFVFKKDF